MRISLSFLFAIAVSASAGLSQEPSTDSPPAPSGVEPASKVEEIAAPPTSGVAIWDGENGSCGAWADSCGSRNNAWVSVDYLLWWTRRGPVNTPLLTVGSTEDEVPGALGQPGTHVLFGSDLDFHGFSGLKLSGGWALNSCVMLEANYFALERRAVLFHAASDETGSPVIGRPAFNNQTGREDIYATSNPDAWAGTTDIASHSRLQGYEFNLRRTNCGNFNWLMGFRALDLNEDLLVRDHLVPLVAENLTFEGELVDPPSTLSDFDRFHASNHFYGGQIGGRWERCSGAWTVSLVGKLALGANRESVAINGSTTLSTPDTPSVTAPGGVLAQVTNIGTHERSVFSVVPELGVNVGCRLSCRLEANMGYTFLYWSNVVRPGEQIDRNINPALPPTDQDFGNGLGEARPAFHWHSSDYWAQGLNFGLTLRY